MAELIKAMLEASDNGNNEQLTAIVEQIVKELEQ